MHNFLACSILIIYFYLYLEYNFYIMYLSFLYFYFQEVELCQICGLKPVMDWPSSKVYYKWFGEWMGKCDLNYL